MNTSRIGASFSGVLALFVAVAACGSSDDAELGGSGGTSSGGSKATGGSSNTDGAAGSSSGGSAGEAASCSGSHPLLDAGARFCAVGECRCEATDLCFPQGQAARCCEGKFVCFGSDGPIDCSRQHPVVDGGARFCEPGACLCESEDTCFPAATAAACCPTTPKCP